MQDLDYCQLLSPHLWKRFGRVCVVMSKSMRRSGSFFFLRPGRILGGGPYRNLGKSTFGHLDVWYRPSRYSSPSLTSAVYPISRFDPAILILFSLHTGLPAVPSTNLTAYQWGTNFGSTGWYKLPQPLPLSTLRTRPSNEHNDGPVGRHTCPFFSPHRHLTPQCVNSNI